jgi:hypothetical protein
MGIWDAQRLGARDPGASLCPRQNRAVTVPGPTQVQVLAGLVQANIQ